MTTLVELGLTNAVLVAILAAAVFLITRIWRNPHLAHVLWLLVLLKMVTPPLVRIPIPLRLNASGDQLALTSGSTLSSSRTSDLEVIHGPGQGNHVVLESVESKWVVQPPVDRLSESAASQEGWTRTTVGTLARRWWPFLVGAVWLSGSVLCGLVACVRIVRFHFKLKETDVACQTLQPVGDAVARQLGLKASPQLRVTDSKLGPIVWPIGRPPTVVLPQGLVAQLTHDELKTIVAHEFAHVVRRDHWVRWLEVLCTVVYWWHPGLWIARRRLRLAEEACCDALVLATIPGKSQTYGEALLKVVDFVPDFYPTTPVLASGIGENSHIKRRLEMVLSNRLPSHLSQMTKGVLLVLALGVLAISAEVDKGEQQKVEKVSGVLDVESDPTSERQVTVEDVLRTWQRRQDSIASFLYEWEEKTILFTGILKHSDPLGPDGGEYYSSPKLEIPLKSVKRYGREVENYLYQLEGQFWDADKNVRSHRKRTVTFDGVRHKEVLETQWGIDTMSRGSIVRTGKPDEDFRNLSSIIPVELGMTPGDSLPRRGYDLTQMKVSTPHVIWNERDCVVLTNTRGGHGEIGLVYVDRSRDYIPLRFVQEYKGIVSYDLSVQYTHHDDAGWRVSRWDEKQFNESGELTSSTACQVKRCLINEPLDKDMFTFEFPVGAKIRERDGETTKYFITLKNGQRGYISEDEYGRLPWATD